MNVAANFGMEMSEKRFEWTLTIRRTGRGSKHMTATQTFSVEHIETPTGRMRIVCDDAQRLRAVEWDDYEVAHAGPAASILRSERAWSCAKPHGRRRPRRRCSLISTAISAPSPICRPRQTARRSSTRSGRRSALFRPDARSATACLPRRSDAEGGARGRARKRRQSDRHRRALPSGDRRRTLR